MSNPILETLTMTITKNKGTPSETKEERTYDIPQGTVTEADFEEAEGTKADAIVRSASGDIASYDDGGDLPMKSLKVNIVPKQSGTGDPSPSNVRPISGTDTVKVTRSGLNVYNPSVMDLLASDVVLNGDTFTMPWANGAYKITGKNKQVYPSGTYTAQIIGTGNIDYVLIAVCKASDNSLMRTIYSPAIVHTFTADEPFYLAIYGNYNNPGTATFKVLLEPGSTLHDYQPFKSLETKSISLPQTVYGGTLDVVSGKLVIDRAITDLGDYEWSYYSQYSAFFGTPAIPSTYGDFVCSKYKYAGVNETLSELTGKPDKSVLNRVNSGTIHSICIKDSSYTDGATFRTGATGTKLVYFLATPTEIDLTPTEVKSLLGDNNVWSDSGSVEVEYRADTSLVINKILEALA